MPLKHPTETFFIILLACVTAIVGMLTSLLPHFPEGVLPWFTLLVVVIVYPLVLIPTFKENRADYELRVLHWSPLIIVGIWGFLEILSAFIPFAATIQIGFSYLWSLPIVLLSLGLLMLFCRHVIRCLYLRITVLTAILLLVLGCSISAQASGWNPRLTDRLYVQHIGASLLGKRTTELASRWFSPRETAASASLISQSVSSSSKVKSATTRSSSSRALVGAKDSALPKSGPLETLLSAVLIALAFSCAKIQKKAKMENSYAMSSKD